jgi:hypothetical protein
MRWLTRYTVMNDLFEGDDALLFEFFGFEGPIFTSVLRCFKLCLYNIVFVVLFEVGAFLAYSREYLTRGSTRCAR